MRILPTTLFSPTLSIVSSFTAKAILCSIGLTVTLSATAASKNSLYDEINAQISMNPIVSSQQATQSQKRGIQLGLNVIATGSPYHTDESNLTILPSVFYDNKRVYARGSQLGGYFVNTPQHEVAAFFQPAGYSFDPDEVKSSLSGLDERKWSGMLGASYLRRTSIGGFKIQAATDVLGNSEGTTAKLSYLTRFKKGNWTLYPSIGVEWANEDYNNYYYGVSNKESARTGVSAYHVDSTITPYVNINANYDINKDWALFAGQNIGHMVEEQVDSPMVDNRTTYRTTIGLLYKF